MSSVQYHSVFVSIYQLSFCLTWYGICHVLQACSPFCTMRNVKNQRKKKWNPFWPALPFPRHIIETGCAKVWLCQITVLICCSSSVYFATDYVQSTFLILLKEFSDKKLLSRSELMTQPRIFIAIESVKCLTIRIWQDW